MSGVVLDWSAARWSPGVCVDCGEPANLRDPETGASRHKPCAERVAVPTVVGDGALGPERAAKRSDSVRYRPEGHPFSVARFRDVLAAWPPLPHRLHGPEPEGDGDPAVESPADEVLVPCRALAEGDPCPKGVHTVRAALEGAGWDVRATYALARRDGGLVHSVALRARRQGRHAWAVWVDGKATGGQVQGVRGVLGITAWRVATGSAATPRAARGAQPKAPRKGTLQDPPVEAPPVDLRPMDTPL